jgi:hypothetical protein
MSGRVLKEICYSSPHSEIIYEKHPLQKSSKTLKEVMLLELLCQILSGPFRLMPSAMPGYLVILGILLFKISIHLFPAKSQGGVIRTGW